MDVYRLSSSFDEKIAMENSVSEFSKLQCEACRSGAPAATDEELEHFLQIHSDWEQIDKNDVPRIRRVYSFSNFVDALAFTNKVGDLAEDEGHHPALLTEWGRVTVSWWTHKIGGLHRNDLIMGARTDDLYG
jgi:4a-hydroxytetrahydrobiopterin dehydratase